MTRGSASVGANKAIADCIVSRLTERFLPATRLAAVDRTRAAEQVYISPATYKGSYNWHMLLFETSGWLDAGNAID